MNTPSWPWCGGCVLLISSPDTDSTAQNQFASVWRNLAKPACCHFDGHIDFVWTTSMSIWIYQHQYQ
jgi:hypothetical protein